MSRHLNRKHRAWTGAAAAALLGLVGAGALALPPIPGEPSPDDPMPGDSTPTPGTGSGSGDTNSATPLYPFPEVGGPRQTGEAHAPIGLGALLPALSETDATIRTPHGPLTLGRQYAKGAWHGTNPFGGRDWTHSLHSFIKVVRKRVAPLNPDTCIGAECTTWTVMEPSGDRLTFLPCTPQNRKACYAGEAHEDGPHPEAPAVERSGNLMERNVQLRWDGERFELLRPGKERLVYELFLERPRSHPSLPWYGTAVYVLSAIHGPTTATGTSNRLARLNYWPEGVSPCEGGEMAVDTPALQSVSLAGGSTLNFEWTHAKKLHCPQSPGTPNQTEECTNRALQCVVSAVRLSGPQGRSEPLVRYVYDRDARGYMIPGRVAAVGTPREGGESLTKYSRSELLKETTSSWSELWRVVDDDHERYRQTVTNVQSEHQPAFTYEFITQSRSETGNLVVRALRGEEWLTCVARWDYVRNRGCSFAGDYFEPYFWAPGTYAGGQVQEVIDNHVLLGDDVNSGANGVVTERFFVSGGGKSIYDGAPAIVTRREVECRTGGAPCPGVQDTSQEWLVRSSLNLGTRNERGFWTEYLYTSLEGGPRSPRSEPLVREGRAGLSASTYGADGLPGAPSSMPLHREWYDWEWVGQTEDVRANRGFEARVARIRQDSVVSPSSSVRTEDVPEAAQSIVHIHSAPETSQVKAVIREGWTKRFSPTGQWTDAKERRYLGTFSYTDYRATGGALSQYAQGRVVETHGPCWVSSKDAQGCDVESDGLGTPVQVRVVRFEYQESHGYLTAQSTYSSCGVQGGTVKCAPQSELRTEFLSYDARGNVLRSMDANGVESEFSYSNGRLSAEVTRAPGLTWLFKTYVYDGRRLLAVRMPSGDYHVTCYRKGAAPGCTGGTPSLQIQWRAKAHDPKGINWREKVEYRYEAESGRVSQERYLERVYGGVGILRRVVALGMDAYGRLTRSQDGEEATPNVARASFDVGGNVVSKGEPYHEAPAFCMDPSKRKDPACAGFTYDGLDRLTSLSFGAGGAAAACFEYDSRGNVSRAKLGCESDCASCRNGLELRYEFDDFGRLISVSEPYKSGPTRYQHDAMGKVIVKETPGSPWLTETRHDATGRVLTTTAIAPDGRREVLHAFDYDRGLDEEAAAEGCPLPGDNAGLTGRLQRRQDSYGYHWYVYDALGRTTRIYRQRYGRSCQDGHSEDAPNSFYAYDGMGRLESEAYPHGLVAHYVYGQNDGLGSRVSQVDVSAPGVARRALIRKVQYQPYGGLRAYELATGGTATSVEWLTGVSNTAGSGCGGRPQEVGATTGSIRALWVSRQPLDGTGPGDVFKQVYSWQGGMRVREDTCLLEQSAHTVCYGAGCTKTGTVRGGYDEKLQLIRAERLASGAQVGPFASRQFSYDARGNRTSELRDGKRICYAYQGERLVSVRGAGASGSCSDTSASAADVAYTYDGNGRLVSRGRPTGPMDTFDYDGLTHEVVPASLGAAYRTANVGGQQIESFYDAVGRRWRKEFADGSYREFYWADTELREERAEGTGRASGIGVLDSYLWLEGRPVALVRGWANAPLPSSGTACDRDGEAVPCGLYFPIVDPLGKPVLLLDEAGRVSGTGEYDVFGHVNRVWLPAEAQGESIEFSQRPSGDGRVLVSIRARMLADGSQLPQRSADGLSPSESVVLGLPQKWVGVPSTGVVSVSQLGASHEGQFEGYEYRRHEAGAVPTWVPLRFPGQYHDDETDLFENWNRYYDAGAGRYNSVEPLLASPTYVVESSSDAVGSFSYGYSGNSPLVKSDPTGMVIEFRDPPSARLRAAIRTCLASKECRTMWDAMSNSGTVFNIYEDPNNPTPGSNKHGEGRGDRLVDVVFNFRKAGAVPDWYVVGHEFAHSNEFLNGVAARVVFPYVADQKRRWGEGRIGGIGPRIRDSRGYDPVEYNAQYRAAKIASEVGLPFALPYRPVAPEEFGF